MNCKDIDVLFKLCKFLSQTYVLCWSHQDLLRLKIWTHTSPSLEANALKVIQETLPKLRNAFHVKWVMKYPFLRQLTPHYHDTCISYILSIVNPKNEWWPFTVPSKFT